MKIDEYRKRREVFSRNRENNRDEKCIYSESLGQRLIVCQSDTI
jgi:hypothetical protein